MSADNGLSSEASRVTPVTVSAAPRFDLAINTVTPTFTDALGPDGTTPGHRLVYPILLDYKGLVTGDTLLGYERLGSDVSFVDDVSKMFGKGESPAVLQAFDGNAACGVNTGQIRTMPGGVGGGASSVVDSGRITCSQDGPGKPVTVKITGIDSSLSSIPTTSVSGGTISGGTRPYVVSGYLSLWIPGPESIDTLTATNTYADLVADSVTGQTNFGPQGEPLRNNSVSRNIGVFPGVTGQLRYWGVKDSPVSQFDLSGKYDHPYVTPGQLVRTTTSINNTGTAEWQGSIVCTVFDNTYQKLDHSTGEWAASSSPSVTGRPEYAAYHSDDPESARDKNCGDDDATWHDDPEDVPGGSSAVGLVRWKLDFPAPRTLSFSASLKLSDQVPNYTRLRAFASILPGADRGWLHDGADATEANGAWADFLTATSNLARVTSKVVDDGYDADTTPDKTQYVEQGKTVDFALYPTLTNATEGGKPETVTVRDVLPRATAYVTDSANPAPSTITEETDSDGFTRQVLTWVFTDTQVNDPLPPITFRVRVDSDGVVETATNNATISSLRDISSEKFRLADRGLHILLRGAISVVETAKRTGVVIGDLLEWNLQYTNDADTAVKSTDLITVLPFVGDGRGTTAKDTRLASAVSPLATETVRYTDTTPHSIDTDPTDASNGDDGTTRWCTESQLGTADCPSGLAAVTAIRIERAGAVDVGDSIEHPLSIATSKSHDGDVAGSSFSLRAAGFSALLTSAKPTITAHGGAIGHRAWFDTNSDGLQTEGEPGLDDLTVRLTGTDDRGHSVDESTETDASGDYGFRDLRPGDYVVMFGAADGGWTKARVGDDPALDSDVGVDGTAAATLVAHTEGTSVTAVSSDLQVDAGALPKTDPALPPVVRPPGHGGTVDLGPTRPPASALPERLAFTGSNLGLWVAGLALLGMVIGLAIVVGARRRSHGE